MKLNQTLPPLFPRDKRLIKPNTKREKKRIQPRGEKRSGRNCTHHARSRPSLGMSLSSWLDGRHSHWETKQTLALGVFRLPGIDELERLADNLN